MDDSMDNQLNFITTKDLIEELERRYDHVIFAGMSQARKECGGDVERRTFRWKGHPLMCLGLLHRASGDIFAADVMRDIGPPNE